jgi:hypothetical protein
MNLLTLELNTSQLQPQRKRRPLIGDPLSTRLTANFSRLEMRCKCGCGAGDIDIEFVQLLQKARDYACETAGRTVRFVVTSGVRCTAHAADLKAASSRQRKFIVTGLLFAGLNRIGIGRDFIHVDDDPQKPPNVLFHYYPDSA